MLELLPLELLPLAPFTFELLPLEPPDAALIANIFEVLPAMVPGAQVWVDALVLSGSYMVTEPSEF